MSRLDAHPDLKEQLAYALRQASISPGCRDCDLGAIRAKFNALAEERERLQPRPKDRRRFRT